MRATTLMIPDELRARLREAAARDGISAGEFVRRALRRALEDESARLRRRTRRGRKAGALPTSLEDYLLSPAGTLAAHGLPGDANEPEDPYAGLD
jgi:Arc/MetJ-type ribon-helix-helix transcriptional regulator